MKAGITETLTINGTTLTIGSPTTYEVRDTLQQKLTQTAGRARMDAWWCGDNLPNVLDRYEFALSYELDAQASNITAIEFIERLRTKGGTHTLIDWRWLRYTYTARSGQQFFYLPRVDAFTAAITNHTVQATWGVKVWKNDVAVTVVYKGTVASGDVVSAGEVWFGNTAVTHPESGFLCTPFKFGTTNAINDDILVEFIPQFRVAVIAAPTAPFEKVAQESRALYLAEVAGV